MFFPCPCKCEDKCDQTVGSTIWARVDTGYRIENLAPKYYQLAVVLLIRNLLTDNVLFNALDFENDNKSVTCFSKHLLAIMNGGNSLVMIDSRDNVLVGVLLMSVVNKLEFGRVYSHITMQQGDAYEEYIGLQNYLHKNVDFFLDYNVEKFMRFYSLSIDSEHRHKELGYHLFRAGFEVARHMRVPIACWLTMSEETFDFATKFGFESIKRVDYAEWFIDVDETRFKMPDPRHNVDLMVIKVPAFYITPIVTNKDDSVKEKRAAKKKPAKNKK